MFIEPILAVELNVPILTGEAKLPAAFDNSAVYIFPPLNVPEEVKAIDPVSSVLQSTVKGLPVIAPDVIVLDEAQEVEV